MKYVYTVELPLIASDQWYVLCRAKEPAHLAEVVRIIAEFCSTETACIRITISPNYDATPTA